MMLRPVFQIVFFIKLLLVVAFAPILLSACSGQLSLYQDPNKTFCRQDADCGALEICTTTNGCELLLPACQSDTDCPAGQACAQGLCMLPGHCFLSSQCSEGKACVNNHCQELRCESDADCPHNESCHLSFGTCQEKSCQADADCGADNCCHPVSQTCRPQLICDQWESGVPPACMAEVETCDAQDNDCDGAIDEDFIQLGQNCQVGTGVCFRVGHWICAADGAGEVCDVTPGPSDPEVCDGEDNDCDGEIDEGC